MISLICSEMVLDQGRLIQNITYDGVNSLAIISLYAPDSH
jgi:hypothetical protein